MKAQTTDILMDNKIFAWLAIGTGLILSIPLLAMQFTDQVDWQLFDFIVMGALIFGAGFLFVHIARVAPKQYRTLIGLGILAVVLAAWVHLAVGIVDAWPLAGS